MMKYLHLLLFLLVPAGMLLLFLAIRMARKSFSGQVIVEIPFTQKSADFYLAVPGIYGIWQKGQYMRKLPVGEFRPRITCMATGETVKLVPSIFRPNTNNGRIFKMQIFSFKAEAGLYRLDLVPGSSISALEKGLSQLFPAKNADPEKYFIFIRESQPFLCLLGSILLMVLSGGMMIGGLVAGILVR